MSLSNLASSYFPRRLWPLYKRIKASPLGYRLANGAFWSITGASFSRILLLAASIVVARLLGTTGFGELGVIKSTVSSLGVFAGAGLGLTATKHIAELRRKDPIRAGRMLGLSGLVALLSGSLMGLGLLFLSPWLAAHTLSAPSLAEPLQISALVLFLSALNGAQLGALAGFEAFRTIARVNLLAGLVSFPVLIGGAFLGGVTGAVWALAFNVAINWLLSHLALRSEAARHKIPFTLKSSLSEWPVLWRFSLPAALASVMIAPAEWACAALLVNQPDGYSEMGLFSAANQWRLAILLIPGVLWRVALPLLANVSDDARQYRKVLKTNLVFNGMITAVTVVPIIVLASLIMRAYGPAYMEGGGVLRILSFAAAVTSLSAIATQALVSSGRMWTKLTLDVVKALFLIGASAIFVRKGWGATGLAWAHLIACAGQGIPLVAYLIAVLRKSTGISSAAKANKPPAPKARKITENRVPINGLQENRRAPDQI